jgi:hypothetical protein
LKLHFAETQVFRKLKREVQENGNAYVNGIVEKYHTPGSLKDIIFWQQ